MVLAVFFRVSVALVFLPFTAIPGSGEWNRFFAPILVAIGAVALSFTQHKFLAAIVALHVCILAFPDYYWRASLPWRMDASWSVLAPDLCIVIACVTRWWVASAVANDGVEA